MLPLAARPPPPPARAGAMQEAQQAVTSAKQALLHAREELERVRRRQQQEATVSPLSRLGPGATPAQITRALRRDGAVVVRSLAPPAQMDALAHELGQLAPFARRAEPGSFSGSNTISNGAYLVAACPTAQELALHPTLLGVAEGVTAQHAFCRQSLAWVPMRSVDHAAVRDWRARLAGAVAICAPHRPRCGLGDQGERGRAGAGAAPRRRGVAARPRASSGVFAGWFVHWHHLCRRFPGCNEEAGGGAGAVVDVGRLRLRGGVRGDLRLSRQPPLGSRAGADARRGRACSDAAWLVSASHPSFHGRQAGRLLLR